MCSPLYVRGFAYKTSLCACVLLLSVAGCGRGHKLPPLVEVTGQVTLDGKPVSEGTVAFVPDASKGTSGPMSMGAITNGQYRIKTIGEDGVPAGWYTVTVEGNQGGSMMAEGSNQAATIPPKYRIAEESPLKKEVKAGEENVINLELESGR